MIDEEEEEEGLGEDDGSVTSTRDRKLTPSVRRKLSEALSYSHENFKKPEVIDRSSSSALEGCKNEEEVQQAYVGAENKVINQLTRASEEKAKVQCRSNGESSGSVPPTNAFSWAIILHWSINSFTRYCCCLPFCSISCMLYFCFFKLCGHIHWDKENSVLLGSIHHHSRHIQCIFHY